MPKSDARFLLDAMLGKLARYLRMCGYDTAYALDRGIEDDDRLRDIARAEDRILVTRDQALAARTENALLLESRDIEDQLREIRAAGYELSLDEPARCSACNGPVERVPGDRTTPEYAPDPSAQAVWQCPECGRYFWKGSHWEDVESRLAALGETEA